MPSTRLAAAGLPRRPGRRGLRSRGRCVHESTRLPLLNLLQDNRSLLTDSVDTPAVYAVPKAYWIAHRWPTRCCVQAIICVPGYWISLRRRRRAWIGWGSALRMHRQALGRVRSGPHLCAHCTHQSGPAARGRRKCLRDCSEARMQVRACTGFQRNTRRSWVDFGRSLNRIGSLQPPLPWFSHRRRQTTTTLHRHRCSYVLDPSVRPVAWAQRRGGVMVHVQSPGHRSRHRRGGAGTGRACQWALLLTVEPAFRRRGRP